jgi:hypothetical protein
MESLGARKGMSWSLELQYEAEPVTVRSPVAARTRMGETTGR